jgi:RNA polymerase sigma-70 factor, ECF subfamily
MNPTPAPLASDWSEELLAAARIGDQDAFSALVSPLAPRLYRLARRLTRNLADAEDVCQESIFKAFRKLAKFSQMQEAAGDDFRNWLTRITVNSALDCNRRKRACRVVALEECDYPHLVAYRAAGGWLSENPEGFYARNERIRIAVDAITRLPVQLRSVCLLRNLREFSTKEVAAKLGISTNAVRLRLFRAHAQLRKNLEASILTRHPQHRCAKRGTRVPGCRNSKARHRGPVGVTG